MMLFFVHKKVMHNNTSMQPCLPCLAARNCNNRTSSCAGGDGGHQPTSPLSSWLTDYVGRRLRVVKPQHLQLRQQPNLGWDAAWQRNKPTGDEP